MQDYFNLKIVTVDKELADEKVTSFKCSDIKGEFVILANHSPLIALTVPCHSQYVTVSGETKDLFTSKGLLKLSDNKLLLIVDAGEEKADIDINRAKESLKRAEERLFSKEEGIDLSRARDSKERAEARIKTVEGI